MCPRHWRHRQAKRHRARDDERCCRTSPHRIPPNAVDCMHLTVPVHQIGVNLLCKSHIRAKRTFEDFPLRFPHPLVCRKLHGICEPYVRGGAIRADEIAVVNGVAHKCPLAATAATCKEELGVEGKGFSACYGFEWVLSVYDGISMYSARTSAFPPQVIRV